MYRALSAWVLGSLLLVGSACSSARPSASAAPTPAAAAAPATSASGTGAVGGTGAASGPVAVATAAPARASLTIGVTPLLTASGLYVAVERGYFAEQGLDVTLENVSDPTAMVPSLATGQIDVGNGALSAGLWNAIARGADVRVVAIQSAIRPGIPSAAYVVRKADLDSGAIGAWSSLRGKRVSINGRGNFTHIVLVKALENGGLTEADVDLVDMGQPDALIAVSNGAIDIATLSEPLRGQAIAQGLPVWKEFYEIYPGQQSTAWVYSPRFANERPDVARRAMVGLLKGIRDFHDGFNKDIDREAIVDIIMRYLSVRDRNVYASMKVGVDPNGEIDVATLQNDIDWYVANGFMPQRIDIGRSLDRAFVDHALGQLGRHQP